MPAHMLAIFMLHACPAGWVPTNVPPPAMTAMPYAHAQAGNFVILQPSFAPTVVWCEKSE